MIDGMTALLHDIEKLRRFCAEPPSALINDISHHLIVSVKTNFDSGGRPKWKERKGTYPHPPLMKTKRLYNSIGEILRVTGGEIVVGTAVEYAGWQNDGTKTIDARPFMMIQDDDERYIEQRIREALNAVI